MMSSNIAKGALIGPCAQALATRATARIRIVVIIVMAVLRPSRKLVV
jgi:hypothetical protein